MSASQYLPHACSGSVVYADRLSTEQEGRPLVADGLGEPGGLRHVDGDVVLLAHRLLADAVGRALERQDWR